MTDQNLANSWQQAADDLFARIASILDAARGQIVRAVNHVTVAAYWHIGREVVETLQEGEERAAYGKRVIERLAQRLTEHYGKGFSATNLGYFRQFYLAYRSRIPHALSGELPQGQALALIPHSVRGELPPAFHPNLSWTHYRVLIRVSDIEARQQRIRFADKDFYIDLVFYNYLLKCFVLVDLKIGELTHQDVGQMDGYVRLYEEQHRLKGDNPTIGLILCSEKNEAVARYSVLHESQQLFASRYRFTLPSEEELQKELQRERALIENQMDTTG